MAAMGNLLTWQTGLEKSNAEMAVWSQHSLSVKRFARIICLLYGSDTARYQWIADMAKMPDIRSDWCEDELRGRPAMAWTGSTEDLRRNRRNRDGETPRAHQRRFTKSRARRSRRLALGFLKKRQVLEKAAAIVDTEFDFRAAVSGAGQGLLGAECLLGPGVRASCCSVMTFWKRSAKMSSKPEIAAVGRAFNEHPP